MSKLRVLTESDPSSFLNERIYAGHVLGMCLYSAGVALSIIWSLIAG